MLSYKEIVQRIEAEIKLLQFTTPPKGLFEPIEYILSLGGKRIRPALVLMGCDMYGDSVEKAIKPALGLEIFHNFTLLHDDLMDEAEKRRNKPTVHTVWDANTAILSGDAMLIEAYKMIAETAPEYLKEILDLFNRTSLEICCGQHFDMEFESRLDVSEEEYLEMIRLKTAVLLACGLKMGALLGGAGREDADNLYAFGINIGLAFQLQDDLLDVYGNPDTFGKNLGGDILCNKKTYLLINALKYASEDQRKVMIEWMGKEAFDHERKIALFAGIYKDLRIKEITEKKIEQLYNSAMGHLNALQIAPERTKGLKEVCAQLMFREL